MSVTLSVLGAQVAAASPSPSPAPGSSGFSWGDAALIFVLVIAGLLVLVAFLGRRTRRLTFQPRVRTAHNRRIRRAAEADVDTIQGGRYVPRRDVPDTPEDDL